MKTRVWSTIGFVIGGLLMAQAASALDLATPAFKAKREDSIEVHLRRRGA